MCVYVYNLPYSCSPELPAAVPRSAADAEAPGPAARPGVGTTRPPHAAAAATAVRSTAASNAASNAAASCRKCHRYQTTYLQHITRYATHTFPTTTLIASDITQFQRYHTLLLARHNAGTPHWPATPHMASGITLLGGWQRHHTLPETNAATSHCQRHHILLAAPHIISDTTQCRDTIYSQRHHPVPPHIGNDTIRCQRHHTSGTHTATPHSASDTTHCQRERTLRATPHSAKHHALLGTPHNTSDTTHCQRHHKLLATPHIASHTTHF